MCRGRSRGYSGRSGQGSPLRSAPGHGAALGRHHPAGRDAPGAARAGAAPAPGSNEMLVKVLSSPNHSTTPWPSAYCWLLCSGAELGSAADIWGGPACGDAQIDPAKWGTFWGRAARRGCAGEGEARSAQRRERPGVPRLEMPGFGAGEFGARGRGVQGSGQGNSGFGAGECGVRGRGVRAGSPGSAPALCSPARVSERSGSVLRVSSEPGTQLSSGLCSYPEQALSTPDVSPVPEEL